MFLVLGSSSLHVNSSLRTADLFPVVASPPPREATTGNASAVRRVRKQSLRLNHHILRLYHYLLSERVKQTHQAQS